MMTHYIVETYTILDGWINCWSVDDETETFPSYLDAAEALQDHLDDISEAVEVGLLPEASYDPLAYRITEVTV